MKVTLKVTLHNTPLQYTQSRYISKEEIEFLNLTKEYLLKSFRGEFWKVLFETTSYELSDVVQFSEEIEE